MEKVGDILSSAGHALGDRREVDIVLHLDRDAERLGQLVHESRLVPARQVVGIAELPGVRVECARCGRDDMDEVTDLEFDRFCRLGERSVDGLNRVRPGSAGCPVRSAGDHPVGDVGNHGVDPGRRDVHRADVRGAWIHLVQLRRAAAGARPDRYDEASLFQASEQLRSSRLGEAGQPADLGT